MISITHFGSGKAAKDYFSEHLSKGDYFAKDAEILQPRFEGLTAQMLGIQGKPVDQQSFFALVDNQHPVTGEQLTSRMKIERRSMTDLTFDVPKSVTLAAIVDPRVKAAVESSIDDTMSEIERAMCVRVRKGGKDHDRETGNMLWVKWPHETTRPLSDGTVDPHLHRHVTAINVSYDSVEKVYKATQFGNIVRDKGYYQAAYHARLAEKLSGLGYGVEREQKSFRLMGIEKATLEKFSRRTSVIEEKAKALGITDPDAKADLGRKTRNRKGNELGSNQLTQQWLSRLTPAELKSLERAGSGIHRGRSISAKEAMDHAVEHSFERKSVISEKALLAEALVHGVGSVTVAGVHSQKRDVIRKESDGTVYVTTKAVYQEELNMVAFARDGKGKCSRLAQPDQATAPEVLSEEQERAKERILSSRDRVTILVGGAGTGKTRMMQSTVNAIEAAGRKVFTFAPSADASRGVLRTEGFANADTVERLLTDKNLQREAAGQPLWIDEAGLLSTKDMNRVFELAKWNNNRLILSGDTKQHRAVARGDALRLIEKEAGLKPATLTEIRRQKHAAYKDAVAAISKGELGTGIKKLDAIGAIVETDRDRYELLAKEYVNAVMENKSALVVTPTHREAENVTECIRQGLRAKGRLAGNEKTLDTLYAVNFTVAERKDPLNYSPGMVVQFHQNVKGFRRGDRAEITERTVDGATVVCHGKVHQLPLDQAARFRVYQKSNISVAPGESIRITQNGRLKSEGKEFRPNNGSVYKLAGFTDKGDLRLSSGQILRKDYFHVAHGYTSTSHASQGKTVDKVFISMSQDSLSAANREQFYVSVSRGRESVKLFTDDKQAVYEAVQKSGARMSATELLGKQKPAVDMNRVRRIYNAIKERTREAITNLKEMNYGQRRKA